VIDRPAHTPVAVKAYRHAHLSGAAITLGCVVLFGIVVGAWLAIDAINVQRGQDSVRAVAIDRAAAERGITLVLNRHLSERRLRVLLGAAAAITPEQDALTKIPQQQKPDTAAASKLSASSRESSGIEYLVARLVSEVDDLARSFAVLVPVDAIATLRSACAVGCAAKAAEDDRVSVETAITRIDSNRLDAALEAWRRDVAADPGVTRAWSYLTKPPAVSLDAFLIDAVPSRNLVQSIARQLADSASFGRLHKDEAASANQNLVGRLLWAITAVLFVATWCAGISIALWQIWTLLRWPRKRIVVAVSVAVAVAAGVFAATLDPITPDRFQLLGSMLQMLEGDNGTHMIEASRYFAGMAAAAIVLIVVASWSTMWHDSSDDLEPQLDGLRLVFNAGAVLLVAGALQVAALYSWPASVFDAAIDADAGSKLESTALLVAGFVGAIFSSVLVLSYLPALSVLRVRAINANHKAKLEEKGFEDTWSKGLLRLLQALAPLLAGVPLTGLLTLLQQ
jgi:hypothetical protein